MEVPKSQRQRRKTSADKIIHKEQTKLSKAIGQNAEDLIIERAKVGNQVVKIKPNQILDQSRLPLKQKNKLNLFRNKNNKSNDD